MNRAVISILAFALPSVLLAGPTLVPAPRQATYGQGVFEGPVEARAAAERTIRRDASLPADGYAISVTTNAIAVRAGGAAGEFYARTTLRQLVATNAFGATAPVVEIVDSPAYPWRALMLDEGRHFFGKETVKDLIARMAAHKLNVLHWHLTEDQGWRLDIPGHPELVRAGSRRRASVRYRTSPYWPDGDYAPFRFDENGEAYGPFFYTAADIAEIRAFARAHFVKLVPEIELPGHVRALLAAHPEFSCVGESLPREPRVWWGVERDVICAGNEEALRFLEEILDRVCELFPEADVIHIGGDECPKDRWSACPKCQARIKAEGLGDVHELQSYVTMRMARHLKSRGRRTMGYDAVLIGGALDASIQVNWRKPRARSTVKSACAAAELGHDVALIEDDFAYFDYPQGLADDPCYYIPGRPAITLEDVHALDPLRGLTAKARPHLVGAEGCLWSEYIWTRADLEWKTWPRACALAEALWTGPEKPSFDDFVRRMNRHRRALIADGVNCAPLGRRARTLVAHPQPDAEEAAAADGSPCRPIALRLSSAARAAWERGEGACRPKSLGSVWRTLDGAEPAGPATFLLGCQTAGELSAATLERYVRAGGTLFVAAENLDSGLVPAALAGLRLASARLTGGHDLLDERGACVGTLDGVCALRPVSDFLGAEPWFTDERGRTVVCAHDVGKGRVVTMTCDGMLPKPLGDLLLRVQRETVPFAVEGAVGWGLDRTPDGWRMRFANADAVRDAPVTVRAGALRRMSVTDAETGERLPTPAGLFALTVGAGRRRCVAIRAPAGAEAKK